MYPKHADEEIIMACFFSNDLLYTGKQCYFNRENIQRVAKKELVQKKKKRRRFILEVLGQI